MKTKMLALVLAVSSLLVMGSTCQATVIMNHDETDVYIGGWVTLPGVHNGGLAADAAGNWADGHTPTGWAESSPYFVYQTAYQWTMISSAYGFAFNNTGEIVHAGDVFTVVADLGGSAAGKTPTVEVWATQNIDGTGAATLLANVSRVSNAGEGYNLFTTTGTAGTPASAALAGYYVQVKILGGGAYYDNIVVTSIPEPATMALLGLGGLLLRRKK